MTSQQSFVMQNLMNQQNTNIHPSEFEIDNIGPTGPGQNIFIKRENNQQNQIHCTYEKQYKSTLKTPDTNESIVAKNITIRQSIYPYHQFPYYPLSGQDFAQGRIFEFFRFGNWKIN